jgi:3,4-dihydroxyphenylacetate 2,3-dioxygenase
VTNPTPEPPNIVRSAYAELLVTDLARSRHFWVDLLGLVVQHEDDEAIYLRGFDELTHHNLVLRKADVAAASHLAFRVASPDDLQRAERFYSSKGCATKWYPAGTTKGVGEALRAQDPLGFVVEFFHDIEPAERLQQRYDLRRGAEVSRLDHFNIVVPDIGAAFAHYESLGFGCSETIEDGEKIYAAWMYRKQTVHDVAFTGGAGPRLHHLGFFAHEGANVLRTCDILGSLNLEHHIERGPGRHGVSNAFYVYLRDPDGHRLEIYTSDYYTGDPDHPTLRWDVHDPRRRDFWGNAVIESWYKEATSVLGLDGTVQPLVETALDESAVRVGADGLGDFPVGGAGPGADSG